MRMILLVGTILLGACGQAMQAAGGDPVSLSVEPLTVSAGGSVELILQNHSSTEVGYNLCTSSLERRTDSGWEAVPSDRVCTMELRTLPPGEEAHFTLDLPAELAPGEFRAVNNLTRERAPVRSGTFQVISNI